MSFLSDYWNKIQPSEKEIGISNEAVAQGHMRPWNSDKANIFMITEALKILKPKVIIETGTFEALTTVEMARAIEDPRALLWTFDAAGPVSVYGDGKSVQEDWETNPMFESFKIVKMKREIRINQHNAYYQDQRCKIVFVEGLTQQTLPLMKERIGLWDFWFQDSVHGLPLIQEELAQLKPTSHLGSIIVFDDITANHPLREWFKTSHPNWDYRWTDRGRCQLWVERTR